MTVASTILHAAAGFEFLHRSRQLRAKTFHNMSSDWLRAKGLERDSDGLMIRTLGAVRKICVIQDQPQYDDDIQTLAESNLDIRDVRHMLSRSGASKEDIDAWFEYAADNQECVVTYNDTFARMDDCVHCDYRNAWVHGEESYEVLVGRHEYRTWCESEVEQRAFFCERSEEYYALSYSATAEDYNGDTIAVVWAIANDWYYDEYNSHWTPDPPDDDEDRDGEEDPTIPAYHCAHREWDLEVANTSQRAFFGFEIEVGFSDYEDRHDFYHAHIKGRHVDVVAEHDGSLCDATGLEIITRPMPMQELRAPDNMLRKLLTVLHDKYHIGTGEDGYGIHITTNWGRFNREHKQRFRDMAFDLRKFSVFVAQRESFDYAPLHNKHASGHHNGVSRRSAEALEFRIFRSTTDWSMLMSYVEYIEALSEWTRDENRLVQGPLAQSLFRHWLVLSGKYPHLAARLPTPSTKEMLPCVLPSSSRPIVTSRKIVSESASRTIPTEQDSRTLSEAPLLNPRVWEDVVAWDAVASLSGRDSSSSTNSIPITRNVGLTGEQLYYISESLPEAPIPPTTVTRTF